jgi:hypothetical protein
MAREPLLDVCHRRQLGLGDHATLAPHPASGLPVLHDPLDLPHVQTLFYNAARQHRPVRLAREPEEHLRMADAEKALRDETLDVGIELEKAQRVCHAGARGVCGRRRGPRTHVGAQSRGRR